MQSHQGNPPPRDTGAPHREIKFPISERILKGKMKRVTPCFGAAKEAFTLPLW
jgi:hypothetical protein